MEKTVAVGSGCILVGGSDWTTALETILVDKVRQKMMPGGGAGLIE